MLTWTPSTPATAHSTCGQRADGAACTNRTPRVATGSPPRSRDAFPSGLGRTRADRPTGALCTTDPAGTSDLLLTGVSAGGPGGQDGWWTPAPLGGHMSVHERAGQPAEPGDLVDIAHLVTA